ncbi:MAG: cell division protein FtsK, partial [Actinomycetes bacterium]
MLGYQAREGWVPWITLALLALGLGVYGGPADRRGLLDTAVTPTGHTKLTSEIVTRALLSVGIGGINVRTRITFPAPITRDGPGWRAEVDLPYGVTATDVLERRDKLASGLRRPLGCVWPEPVHDEHAGRLVIWVGDADLSQAKPTPWPLARTGATDLFKPVPFGTDQRGRPVLILLMFANVLIGAMPRFGKTFAMRVLALAAALDVLVELRVFELKGTGDLGAVEGCCHHYASGPDDDTITATVASLEELDAELERRAKVIRGLPATVCPENKITPELAKRRDLRLHPVAMFIDECQELFTHPEHGPHAAELCIRIIKRGPALGIILILATQRPDSKSLPTGVSANVGIRLCLRVMGQLENDMVLGTSAYRNGIRATTFGPRDKGIGYLVGAADDPQIVRSYYIDQPRAQAIGQRARGLRDAAGRLSGHAVGIQTLDAVTGPTDTLLTDLLAVLPADEDKTWSDNLLTRLAAHRPGTYSGWKPEQLAA